jgi:isopentenyl diphosphate isomerase/L-lactate dehydrogenase-like FMN-dependent dehydrogenase
MARMKNALNLEDVRKEAKRRLPSAIFDIIDGGVGDDVTLRGNRSAYDAISLRPRALADVRSVDLTTKVLGDELRMPFMLAPCSFGRVCDPEAEKAVARAAVSMGTTYAVPGGASERPEDVMAAAPGPLWYQLYMSPRQEDNEQLLDRVEGAGYRVLCVSIDTPMKPYRETDLRNRMTLPVTITPKLVMTGLSRPRWAKDFLIGNSSAGFSLTAARDAYTNFTGAMSHLRPVTRTDIEWLRERWAGPLVVKGILRGEEIDELVRIGVDAVVVSNHGGRNLDTAIPTIAALPEVVEAAGGRLDVLIDGGVRRGTDIVKALALGANAVLVGRPYMFGLAAAGQDGVARVIAMLRDEVQRAMAFVGAASIADIDAGLVALPGAVPGTLPSTLLQH